MVFLSVEDFLENVIKEIELGDVFGLNIIRIKREKEDFIFMENVDYKIKNENELYIKNKKCNERIHIKNIKNVDIDLSRVKIITDDKQFILELM